MRDWGVCKDCALKENCAEYKPYKWQCEDYERYKEVLTNEEWLRQCTTEQLAEVFNTIINRCYECGGDTRVYCCPFGDCECNVVEWLKQPHTSKE